MLYNICLYAIIYIFLYDNQYSFIWYVIFFLYEIIHAPPHPPSVSVGVTGVLHEYA